MLSREDSRRLAELERNLWRDDPEFCSRMSDGRAPRAGLSRRLSLSLMLTAVVIWVAAIILGVLGWWIAAAIAALFGTVVVAALVYRVRRHRSSS